MIAKLTGLIDTLEEDAVILDVSGVGYRIYTTRQTLSQLSSGMVSLLIEPLVRQEQTTLYGFITSKEQQWFRLLLTIQGVGAKVALALLSTFTPEELAHAIASQDRTLICRADGVGPKLASRILAELKDKVGEAQILLSTPPSPAPAFAEAISALLNLGYRRAEVLKALTDAPQSGDTPALIRYALNHLSTALS